MDAPGREDHIKEVHNAVLLSSNAFLHTLKDGC